MSSPELKPETPASPDIDDSSSESHSASDSLKRKGREQSVDNISIRDDADSQSSNEDEIYGEDLQDIEVESSANHAKCILTHNYARFEWSRDPKDYRAFHRPDVHESFCEELHQNEATANKLRNHQQKSEFTLEIKISESVDPIVPE